MLVLSLSHSDDLGSVFYIGISERKKRLVIWQSSHRKKSQADFGVCGTKSTTVCRSSGALSCALDSVSAGAVPLFSVWGSSTPFQLPMGPVAFFLLGLCTEPSFRWVPKAPRYWHPGFPSNGSRQLASKSTHLVPQGPDDPPCLRVTLTLPDKKGEQHSAGTALELVSVS